MDKIKACIESYQSTHNLKITGDELGIPWQTVYVYLKKAGVPVVGDKLRYGSDSDRLAALAELEFSRIVPFAVNENEKKFQSKMDFTVGPFGVDVKASRLNQGNKMYQGKRWAFSIKKQEFCADFIVCFGYEDGEMKKIFMMPGELVRKYQSISINPIGKSKWLNYTITAHDLNQFFRMLIEEQAA